MNPYETLLSWCAGTLGGLTGGGLLALAEPDFNLLGGITSSVDKVGVIGFLCFGVWKVSNIARDMFVRLQESHKEALAAKDEHCATLIASKDEMIALLKEQISKTNS